MTNSFKNDNNNFPCDICDKVFASENVLKVHKKIVHKNHPKRLNVLDLQTTSIKIRPSTSEELEVLDVSNHRCDKCKIDFSQEQSYVKHHNFVHKRAKSPKKMKNV